MTDELTEEERSAKILEYCVKFEQDADEQLHLWRAKQREAGEQLHRWGIRKEHWRRQVERVELGFETQDLPDNYTRY